MCVPVCPPTGGHCYINNTSSTDAQILENTLLAGFTGKGVQFEKGELPTGKGKGELSLPYELKDQDTPVCINNVVKPLSEYIEEKRKTDPTQAPREPYYAFGVTWEPSGAPGRAQVGPRRAPKETPEQDPPSGILLLGLSWSSPGPS